MKLSFTGTRSGLTSRQTQALFYLLLEHQPEEVFHGDCIGADAQFHACCRSLAPVPLITLFPCNLRNQRAFCEGADVIHEPAAPLVRNRKIVDAGDLLIVCPVGLEHVTRSGTWATYRYALSIGKPTIIVWHDGTTTYNYISEGTARPAVVEEDGGVEVVLKRLSALLTPDDGDLPANLDALSAVQQLIAGAASSMGGNFPRGSVSTDGDGGVRVSWVWPEREFRLVAPADRSRSDYIYFDAGEYCGIIENPSSRDLARFLISPAIPVAEPGR